MNPLSAMLFLSGFMKVFTAEEQNRAVQRQLDEQADQVEQAAKNQKLARLTALNKSLGHEIQQAGMGAGLQGSQHQVAQNDIDAYNYDATQIEGNAASRERSIAYQRKVTRFNTRVSELGGLVDSGLAYYEPSALGRL
ncbi:MAG: hypothetical protein PUP46_07905 [Endozoicomonas sp. (ex Botrylloides leachii)]|nr:hypothetical protein [Endozoicomonas sp. (ex Botrylloides leachii)]